MVNLDNLGTINDLGEQLFNSNMEDFCLYCGETITEDNDSCWERFRDDGITTQKICKTCNATEQWPQKKQIEQ